MKGGIILHIFILSEQGTVYNDLLLKMDDLIWQGYSHCLSMYSMHPLTLADVRSHPFPAGHYYIIIDTRSYPDILKTIAVLQHYVPSFITGVIAFSDEYAAVLLNEDHACPILGYINLSCADPSPQLNSIFSLLSSHCLNASRKLCIRYAGITQLIDFSDICFIVTNKGSHNCTISCTCDDFSIRSTIKELIQKLDSRFLLVRSSTIANLTAIDYIDAGNRILHFGNQRCCTYAQTSYASIRRQLAAINSEPL